MISEDAFEHLNALPNHKSLFADLCSFFLQEPDVAACFLSGSGASGGMDAYSDLDLGFLCKSQAARERLWQQRWNWDLPNWFHRMDADHVKPYFVIYLFDPDIHVDLAFYTMESMPTFRAAPFKLVWDRENLLTDWISDVNAPRRIDTDWSNAVHEDERFWTWTHYLWCHIARGEYYDAASDLAPVIQLVQTWHARLGGFADFDTRRLEQRGEQKFIEDMTPCFAKPIRQELKTALLKLIEIHNEQRKKVEELIAPQWTTAQLARDRISQLVGAL